MKQPVPLTHGDCSELKWNLPETIATYYLAQSREQAARDLAARLPRLIPQRQVT